MDELRLILIVAGILIIGLIYLFSRRSYQRGESAVDEPPIEDTEWMEEIARQRRKLSSARSQPTIDESPADIPVLDDAVPLPPEAEKGSGPVSAPEAEPVSKPGVEESAPASEKCDEPTAPAEPAPPRAEAPAVEQKVSGDGPAGEEGLVLALHVTAPEEMVFVGADLFSALEEIGLRFGEGGIFHFYQELEEGEQGPPLFSVANILEPGTFEPEKPGEQFTTPGVVLFMCAPGPQPARTTLETMLLKSHQLAQLLGGEIRDQNRDPLTESGIQSMLDRATAFDLSAG
ncbi:MAG TPA: cell division protein ZipA [Chloroflexi bacterium]|nr:cell division protein ZipA [Chloroflexota bacterium]